MAWISFHEQCIGSSKLRSLYKRVGCSEDEAIGILIRLWIWSLKNIKDADTGMLIDCGRDDVAEVLGVGISKELDPDDVVQSLIETGWMDEEDGSLFVHDWDEWQEQWYKFLKTKESNRERKRKERNSKKVPDANETLPENSDCHEESHSDSHSDNAENETKPVKKQREPKKAEEPKVAFTDFVSLKQKEYEKLVAEYGEPAAQKMIEILSNYKGANGKKYKSDYMAILNWVVDRVKEKHPGLIRKPEEPAKNGDDGNPFKDWRN